MFFPTIVVLLLFYIDNICGQNVLVNTSRGQLVGYHFQQGTVALYYGQADIFLGIPFVQPPVGKLRFAYPQRLDKFPGYPNTYNATYDRLSCPQPLMEAKFYSEDCLYLSIQSPNVSTTNLYPVMVYIHGGGFMTGNNHLGIDGTVRNLVARGVLLVSIQYRLGFLGFFTTSTDDFPPNLGLLDQVEALKFIQDEIANFGGNKNLVTLFGMSAGGISASAHTYSPLSQNLFHHAISESGVVLSGFEGALGPSGRNQRFAEEVCSYTNDQWNSGNYTLLKNCLLNLDPVIGVNHTYNNVPLNNPFGNAVCWNIVQDNNFFPDVPRNLAKKRQNKPVMMGTSKEEWAVWEHLRMSDNETFLKNYTKSYVEEYMTTRFVNYFGNQSKTIMEVLESVYLDPNVQDGDYVSWLKFLINVNTAFFFTSETGREAEYHLQNNNSNVYLYEFTYTNNYFPEFNLSPYPTFGYHPDPHVSEGGFVFFSSGLWQHYNFTQADIDLADFIGESWTNFAKYGIPNNSFYNWTPTTSIGLTTMQYFDMGNSRGMKSGYRVLDRAVMDRILPIFVGTLPPDTQSTGTTSNPLLQTTTSNKNLRIISSKIFVALIILLALL